MDTAFCRIYHVECRGWVEQKRFSLVMLAVLVLLLAASVAVPTIESAALAGAEDLPWGLDELGAIRTTIVALGGFAITFVVVCLIYWAVPKGHMPWRSVWPGALFFSSAVGDRQLRLPVLPDDRLRPRPARGRARLRPRRAALVLRGQPRAARGRGDQLAAPRARRHRVNSRSRGDGAAMRRAAIRSRRSSVRILPDPEAGPVTPDGPLRSVQEAELAMPEQRRSSELWNAATLERLARAYWRVPAQDLASA